MRVLSRATPWRLVLAAALLAGCATVRGGAPSVEDLDRRYAAAVAATRYPTQQRVSRDLVPILRSTPGLRWNDAGQVLMVTWTKATYYEGRLGAEYVLPQNVTVWLTPAPFLQRFCRGLDLPPDDLRLRIAQLLGMPPGASNDAFVEMWVDPGSFFRPCPDPEIGDRECRVNLTVGEIDRDAPCPWQAALAQQVSGAFVTVAPDHLRWMCDNWRDTYTGARSYPWTALGYTYDWGDPKDPVGQSEYVAPPGTSVRIESITATADYCRPPRGRGVRWRHARPRAEPRRRDP